MTGVAVIYETTILQAQVSKLMFALEPAVLMGWMEAAVEPYIKERVRARFAKEGDDAVGQWAPLQATTVSIRSEAGYGSGPINHRTGELESFMTNAEGGYVTSGGDAVMIYPGATGDTTIQQKLSVAQRGLASTPLDGGGTGGPTPARPVIGLGMADMAFVLTSLEAFLVGM